MNNVIFICMEVINTNLLVKIDIRVLEVFFLFLLCITGKVPSINFVWYICHHYTDFEIYVKVSKEKKNGRPNLTWPTFPNHQDYLRMWQWGSGSMYKCHVSVQFNMAKENQNLGWSTSKTWWEVEYFIQETHPSRCLFPPNLSPWRRATTHLDSHFLSLMHEMVEEDW